MIWDQLTSPEIDALNRDIPVLLLVSATEQHGAHLPLATDRMIGEYFCQQLEKNMSDQVLILPSIAVGCSEHHMDLSGSLTVRHQTLLQQMTEIVESVVHHGFKRIMILNSHGGNQGIGQVWLESFGYRHPECHILFTSWWRLATEELRALNQSGFGGIGHAGEFETSLMLLIAPHLVKKDHFKRGKKLEGLDWQKADLLKGPDVSQYRSMKNMTGNGVFGDPGFATEETGHAISRIIGQKLQNLIQDIRNLD